MKDKNFKRFVWEKGQVIVLPKSRKEIEEEIINRVKKEALAKKNLIIIEAKKQAEAMLKQAKQDIIKEAQVHIDQVVKKNAIKKQEKPDKLLKQSKKQASEIIEEAKLESKTIIEKAKDLAIKKKNDILDELKGLRDKAREVIYRQDKSD